MTLKSRAGDSGQNGKKKKSSNAKPMKEDKETVQLLAQEIKMARALAGNDKKSRDRVLKTLRRWISLRCTKHCEFKEEDFSRIWKGLFYSVWMSDKPLVQEELCELISGLLDVFPKRHSQAAVMFFKCSMQTLATEWYGLDQHRMDKFLMLVRRLLRASFRVACRESWSLDCCRQLAEALGAPDGVLAPTPPPFARNALALQMHIVDCFMEELAKVSKGTLPDKALVELVAPLARCMALSSESRLSGCIKRSVMVHLLRQSREGQEYEEKKNAWTKMGCPEGGVDSLEKVAESDAENSGNSDDDDDNSDGRPLDPRAGHVDVILPALPVPAQRLADMLRPLARDKHTSTANRHRVRVCIQHFEELASGKYPLRAREDAMTEDARPQRKQRPARAARRLHEFEKKVNAQSDELALRGLSRKHRKRVLAKHREWLSGADEALAAETESKQATGVGSGRKAKRRRSDAGTASGDWQVEEAVPTSEKKEKVNKKDNQPAKKVKTNKRKLATTLQDEVPLKKLKNLLKEKGTNEGAAKVSKKLTEELKKTEKIMEKVVKTELTQKTPKKSKENIPKITKPTLIAKKIGSSKSKITKSPEKKGFQKKTAEQSPKKDPKNKLRGKKVEKSSKKETKKEEKKMLITPKKVTIVLKNNTTQGPIDYYKSVKQSPSIPFDSKKKPAKTNLKPNSTPSPINPFFKKKLRIKM